MLGNYNITYNTASFTIEPKAASVTPNAASKTYGAADPALTGTLTGFLAADGVTATYSRTAGETVAGGPYTISATLSPAGVLGNYTITYNTAELHDRPEGCFGDAERGEQDLRRGRSGVHRHADRVPGRGRRDGDLQPHGGRDGCGGPYTISATLSPAGVLGNYNITYNTAELHD